MLDWLINFVGPKRVVHEFFKLMEGKAYDAIADGFSEYAGVMDSTHPNARRIFDRERLELRREIRQRGKNGPKGPINKPERLDNKTAFGQGPLVFVFVSDEEVPEALWPLLIRDKRRDD